MQFQGLAKFEMAYVMKIPKDIEGLLKFLEIIQVTRISSLFAGVKFANLESHN